MGQQVQYSDSKPSVQGAQPGDLWIRKTGGGIFVYDSTQKDFLQMDYPILNVKTFGAKGDGVTDDTAAIQSAFTAAQVNGDTVVVPPGNYLISSTLNWTAPLFIRGSQGFQNLSSSGARIFTNTAGITMLTVNLGVSGSNQETGGSMEGIFWDGNSKASVGMLIQSTTLLTTKMDFSRCSFNNCTHLGVHVTGTTGNDHSFTFFRCSFIQNGITSNLVTDAGVQVTKANSVTFYSCNCEINFGCGYIFAGGGTQNHAIINGVIEGNQWHGINTTANVRNVLIENVDFEVNNQVNAANINDITLISTAVIRWKISGCFFSPGNEAFVINNKGAGTIIENCFLVAGSIHWDSTATGGAYIGELADLDATSSFGGNNTARILSQVGVDNRSGITVADGSPITLFSVSARTKQVFLVHIEIDATAFTSGTATYTCTWTENGVPQSAAVQATVLNVVTGIVRLAQPDPSTAITVQLTGAFVATVRLTCIVEPKL